MQELPIARQVPVRYTLTLTGFLAAVAAILLTVVDMRRGFLLPPQAYAQLGSPSAFLFYTPGHWAALALGLIGAWLAYRALQAWDAEAARLGLNYRFGRDVLAGLLMLLLIADLFIYRGVQASRVVQAGRLGVSQTFNLATLPDWLRPLGEAANFLLVVWHATFLGILIGALFLVLLCSGERIKGAFRLTGLRAHLVGSVSAIAYPFCSCCAGPLGASLYWGGASLGAALAFVVGAPLLNVTTLLLAATLLPPQFALLRIAGGVLLAVCGTWLVARAVRARPPAVAPPGAARGLRLLEGLSRPFACEQAVAG